MIEASTMSRKLTPEKNREYRLRAEARHPEKVRARWMTRDAIRRGELIRQPCEKCGSIPTQAHHDDYAMPLAVRWLCHPCHVDHHKGSTYQYALRSRAKKTLCKRGHAFTPENTMNCADGKRRCRACFNWRRRKERNF